MSDTESFESAINESFEIAKAKLRVAFEGKLFERLLSDLQAAHDREIRDTAQREYHRGYEDGRHSMDAEHRAVAMRLRGLRFDGGSHENLSSIAYAIYPCATGWTCESAAGLRDKLIDLMGGVSDGRCEWLHGGTDGNPLIPVWPRDEKQKEVSDGRVADDCSGDTDSGYRSSDIHFDGVTGYGAKHETDEPKLSDLWGMWKDTDGTCPNDVPTSSITDELREWMDLVLTADDQAWAIADRIDERAKHDRESDQLRIEKLVRQRDMLKRAAERDADLIESMACDLNDTEIERDELRTKLDKANGENKGLRLSVDEQKESIAQRKKTIKKLMRDNEKLEKQRDELRDERDELQAKLDGYERHDTAESIVRDLELGTITESQAIDRIEALPWLMCCDPITT